MTSQTAVAIPFDPLTTEIADCVDGYAVASDAAYGMARHCLMDSLACALEALERPSCVNLLGPRWCRARRWRTARACRARASCSIRPPRHSTSAP